MAKNEMAIYGGFLSTDVNFNELNSAIGKLGEHNEDLSDKEKEIGVDLLKDWESNVLQKIENKKSELEKIKSFINDGNHWGIKDDEKAFMEDKLAEITKSQALLTKYREIRTAVKDLNRTTPNSPTTDPNKTIIENDLAYSKYRVEATKFDIEVKKLQYVKTKAEQAWKKKVRTHKDVKAFLGQVSSYMRKVKKYQVDCKEKAQMARINISISSVEVRDSIREMIDFTQKFK